VHFVRRLGVIALSLSAVAGCGTAGSTQRDPLQAAPLASGAVITTVITPGVAARPGDAAAYSPVEATASLRPGDGLRTDETGFAEVTFADGSLMRLDALTEIEVTELGEATSTPAGRVTLATGRVWARTVDAPSGGFTVTTRLATAAGSGTAFTVECPTQDACTYTVLEGTITLTTSDGNTSELAAPRSVTVTAADSP